MDAIQLVKQVRSLFSLPEIALRVNELLTVPEPSILELEGVIINDPALTANILKLVNSAYFGMPGKIDTVSRAITLVGFNELRNIVMATSVTTRFKGIPAELVDMDVFWYHSVTCGVLSRNLAKRLKHPDQERFFIAGLLSSIGKLIFFSTYPRESAEILALKEQGDEVMTAAEIEHFGFNYADLGAELLKQWKLPPNIWELIAFQLDPLKANTPREDVCIINVARKIVNSIEPCAKFDFNFDILEPTLNSDVLAFLKLTPNVIQGAIDDALFQAYEVMCIIRPQAATIY